MMFSLMLGSLNGVAHLDVSLIPLTQLPPLAAAATVALHLND